jgi:hypothetical protein
MMLLPQRSTQTLGSEMMVRKLWTLKQRDGAEVECQLFHVIGEATIEVSVRGSQGEDVRATKIAESLRQLLVAEGATAASPEGSVGRPRNE